MGRMRKTSVAICQPTVIRGGRLSVILDIIRYLNSRGIVPDIITSDIRFDLSETFGSYSKPMEANLRLIPTLPIVAGDLHTLLFNWHLRKYTKAYHLIINTSNSLEFLPKQPKILSYVFFPRRRRLMSDLPDLHLPDMKLRPLSRARIQRSSARLIYRYARPTHNQSVVCMTQFTKDALLTDYDSFSNPPIVYPAVDMARYELREDPPLAFSDRENAIVTIGRFSPDKRQLEQVLLAQKVPSMQFHIIGFTASEAYFQLCRSMVDEQQIENVHLHPNLAFSDMIKYLQNSKYFLHTLINEPFGLTAVQAIVSGAIPLVHDSGGQRETVIDATLRYKNVEQVAGIVASFEQKSLPKIQKMATKLKDHVHQEFSQEVFQENIGLVLEPLIA